MWGLCQNVEIIHQHHHHFYEVMVTTPNRNRSAYSKRTNPETTLAPHSPSSPSCRNDSRLDTFSSRFYHSKRAYLTGSQRGIHLLTPTHASSF